MLELPNDVFALFALAFAFGIKHGLDPDHLVTIDGLSRFNVASQPGLARWAGVLFSIGHGLIVTAVVVLAALMPARLSLPGWLEDFGTAVSILTLLTLGVLNLHAACTRPNNTGNPGGLKGWIIMQSGHPAIVLGIGALFAISFDTLSLAIFFSLASVQLSLEVYAFVLGFLFTCGMIFSDGLNGMLTAHLLKQSNARTRIASRVMSFAIGSASLIVAVISISRLGTPALAADSAYMKIWPGVGVLLWVTASFALSVYLSRAKGRPQS